MSVSSLGLLEDQLKTLDESRAFKCSQCGKSVTNLGNLKTHQRIHTGDKPFSCSDCDKSFSQNNDLNIHQKINKGESVACSYCGKSFSKPSTLKTHIQKIHTGESILKGSIPDHPFPLSPSHTDPSSSLIQTCFP